MELEKKLKDKKRANFYFFYMIKIKKIDLSLI